MFGEKSGLHGARPSERFRDLQDSLHPTSSEIDEVEMCGEG